MGPREPLRIRPQTRVDRILCSWQGIDVGAIGGEAGRHLGTFGDGAVAGDQDVDVPGGLSQPNECRLVGAHLIRAASVEKRDRDIGLVNGVIECPPVRPLDALALPFGQLGVQVPSAVKTTALPIRSWPTLLDRLDQPRDAVGDDQHRRAQAASDQVAGELLPVIVRLAHPQRHREEHLLALDTDHAPRSCVCLEPVALDDDVKHLRSAQCGAAPQGIAFFAMAPLLLIEEPSPHVVQLALNRPEQLNAMTSELCEELHTQLRRIATKRACRVVILTGAGRGFCAGVDLRGYGAAPGNDGSDEPRDRLANQEHMSTLVLGLRALPQPVIAAVNGPAAGLGLALCLACDIRYASVQAVFRAAFINIGVSNCDMGTSWLLPRLIGASRSHELMLTGRRFDAKEALRIGLVADVVDEPRLLERAVQAAEQIAALSPWGVRLTKRGIWSALEISSEQASIEYEDRQQIMATFSHAVPEAVGAFLEKRPASFSN